MIQTARHIVYLLTAILLFSCHSTPPPVKDAIFTRLDSSQTGLDFNNTLHPTQQFNVFDYMYFYNGGGVGAADFNNDGRIDLFFAANQGNDKLYLNEGDMHFKDVTTAATIPQD